MSLPFNTPITRGVLYVLVTLSAVIVFGNAAEICDFINSCPARIAAVIGFGVIAFVVAAFTAIATLCRIAPFIKIEFLFALFVAILFSVMAGLASSVRTQIARTFAATFAWVGTVLSIVLVFMAAFAEDGMFDVQHIDEEDDEEAAKVRYTEPTGPPPAHVSSDATLRESESAKPTEPQQQSP